ncbi:hypothetical protein [Streptomyces sp. NBC_01530]|uniref:hypothetical protein n=1 Tax=Streptomyces sp. NBC_01530 TaxID=2903895 RepID=UPI00386BA46E
MTVNEIGDLYCMLREIHHVLGIGNATDRPGSTMPEGISQFQGAGREAVAPHQQDFALAVEQDCGRNGASRTTWC